MPKPASDHAFPDATPIRFAYPPLILVVMGVSGSGKSTISALLADRLHCEFREGDDLHSTADVAKMGAGVALTDAERLPWLERIAETIDGWQASGRSGVVSCSALKRSYREIIIGRRRAVALVYLRGTYDLIRNRLRGRLGHFMPPELLASQFEALDEPTAEEHPICVDIGGSPREIVHEIIRLLEFRARGLVMENGSRPRTIGGAPPKPPRE